MHGMTDTVAGRMANMRIRTMALWMGLVAVPCYIIDQATKWLVYSRMDIGEGFTVVPGFFDIIHVRNTGAAFGMLQGFPEPFRTYFFLGITIIAFIAMFVVFVRA
ncbi:MAG TPA: signal peptidase II, partial [Deltaproteobacteria bacterium]|nr:signal peptidase II [Deltaproteobacteria bacterium]